MTPSYALSDCYFGSDLFRQLAKAEQELKEIRAENERLMAELNALRNDLERFIRRGNGENHEH
jgi:hypothetical protein